jgi:hypothetical protein
MRRRRCIRGIETDVVLRPPLDSLWDVADRARAKPRLAPKDISFVRDVAPEQFDAFPKLKLPPTVRHPAGFSISGASVGTFLRSALLVAGQKALGRRCGGSEFYERVEKDLAFGIMRSHFHHGYPKGTHCCVQCTLAVYPVLESGGIRYFDCKTLAGDVKRLIEGGGWRFANLPSDSMVRWALLGVSGRK